MLTNLGWEEIDDRDDSSTERARVPGGWLVRTCSWDWQDGEVLHMGATFVPDPEHTWEVPDAD